MTTTTCPHWCNTIDHTVGTNAADRAEGYQLHSRDYIGSGGIRQFSLIYTTYTDPKHNAAADVATGIGSWQPETMAEVDEACELFRAALLHALETNQTASAGGVRL